MAVAGMAGTKAAAWWAATSPSRATRANLRMAAAAGAAGCCCLILGWGLGGWTVVMVVAPRHGNCGHGSSGVG